MPLTVLLPAVLVSAVARSPGAGAAAALATGALLAMRARSQRRRQRLADLGRLVALCDGMTGLLRAGAAPQDAWSQASRLALDGEHVDREAGPGPRPAARAAERDGVRYRAHTPPALLRVQACVRLCEASGAPLADVLAAVSADARAALEARRELDAAVAPARLSGLMLAGLPILGLGVGASLGAAPGHVLLHTTGGAVCLLVAVGFEAVGLGWLDRITTHAEGSS